MKKPCLLILLPLLFLLASGVAGAAGIKAGHVDLQRLVEQSDAGKEARQKYLTKAQTYQEEINSRTERLTKLKADIEKETGVLGQADPPSQSTIDKDKEYGAQARELQRLLGGYQEELKVYDAELTRKVLEEFGPVVAEYAGREGYDYIFRGYDAMVFASKNGDLTDALIKEFNKKRKK